MSRCAALVVLGAAAAARAEWPPAEAMVGVPTAPSPAVAPAPVVRARPAAPVAATVPEPPRPRTRGSLYADDAFQSLTADRRVFRVDDLITVLIHESASASSTADTGAAHDAEASVAANGTRKTLAAGLRTGAEFRGGGRTQRAGRVVAQITVPVLQVATGGDLWIGGEQVLEIDGERQTIRVEGRIRPRDVGEQNTVLSTRLADARIALVGDGVIADEQRPRWWRRVLALFGI